MDQFSDIDQALLSGGTTMRLLLACALGGAVGVEREWRHKASGLRTTMLICMACAFFTLLSAVLAGEGNPIKGQVSANIVQGRGFLGATLILHTRNRVMGLTSAASVFAVALIGMASGAGLYGAGLYFEAMVATVIVLLSLQLVGAFEAKLGWKHYPTLYEVRSTDQLKMFVAILSMLDRFKIRMNVVDKDNVSKLERIAFLLSTDRKKHKLVLAGLNAADAADQLIAFDEEEE